MIRLGLPRELLLAALLTGCAAAPSPAASPAAPPAAPLASSPPGGSAQAAPPPAAPSTAPHSRTAFSGCLLAANEADAAKHPPPPVTRAAGPVARITAVPGGVSVEHPLTHACCLTGAVTTRLEGRTAVVTERLSGVACRCRCGSTIRTELSLAPGAWTVAVDLDEGGGPKRVAQSEVVVP